ncbi:MAG: DNA topoisomerase III [Firmicutes bacterium]|nr:DNA topoisomerase III [Bacillota bacterium]
MNMTHHKLVIAEKPSVAQSIAAVLGATKRNDGYLSGGGYLVSWCYGHLAELAGADVYDEKYAKWRYDDLPILPASWRFTLKADKAKQFELLRDLMRREDVSEVINACDAGREGELIFRTVYYMAGCTKTMKRLWISSMEDEAIRKGFADLRPGREYDGLHQSALCRARADWLVGINATRLFSVLYHRTLNVGRVMTPTLALIVQREAEIAAFRPEAFYTVSLGCGSLAAVSEKLRNKEAADALAAACAGQPVTVRTVQRTEKTENAPRLYDLTARTDSRFLTDDLEASVPELAAVAAVICETDAPGRVNAGQVCDSKKVSDHHAILPTASAGKADTSVLPLGEREILRLVAGQLLRAVSDAHRYAETVVMLECGGAVFTVKGRTTLTPGWKRYLAQEKQDAALPELSEGQVLDCAEAAVKEGKTTPPKHFTEDTLLSAMETAGKEDMPEEAERKGLGTPATRAAIIEKLVSTGFVERKRAKKAVSLVPAHTGVSLITVLPEQLQSPLLTAEWEYRLQQVECGELSPDEFMTGIADMLTELVKTYKVISGAEVLFPSGREVIGKCPRCGSDVTESKKGFFCEKNDCRFGLWRDNKFFAAKRAALTKKVAAALLADGRVKLTGLYSEKTGGTYDATAVLEDTGESVRFRLEFDKGART